MKKVIILLLFSALLVSSCATIGSMMSANRNMKAVEINMTKGQVIAIMGDAYELIGSTEEVEIIGYKTADDAIYKLYFEDNKLKEWHKEWLIPSDHHCD